jgi:predicted alpha/beta hydrolase family esterase
MKMKRQLMVIHGGNAFRNRKEYLRHLRTRKITIDNVASWSREYLARSLGAGVQTINPRMPQPDNARYEDWKLHFERHFPYIRDGIILIGNSLGGMFLAKYLSEHKLPRKILSVYLVGTPYYSARRNREIGGFGLKPDLSLLEENAKNLYLLFSKDDDEIPVSDAKRFAKKLKSAKIIIYGNKNGHFRVSSFPEIIKLIKSDIKMEH